jgi:MarC family membrane protein
MTLFTAAMTLILVMDPLGNVPAFISILNKFESKRRRRIILRETFIAFLILSLFLFSGNAILDSLNISESALGVSGGIILFLIAIKLIFPSQEYPITREQELTEPFIVPLAIPFIAGPSALATVLLLASQAPELINRWFIALILASCTCAIILLFSNQLSKILGKKGLLAIERLMGMILTTVAVQMFLTGIKDYFHLST